MNNLGTTLMKFVALTGGAVLGALLARWCDDLLTAQAQQKSDYDRLRYAQGLAPRAPENTVQEEQ